MKRWHFWMGAGVCFALAAVLAAWPAWGQARQGVLALAALAAAVCAIGLAVRALAFGRPALSFAQLRPLPPRRVKRAAAALPVFPVTKKRGLVQWRILSPFRSRTLRAVKRNM